MMDELKWRYRLKEMRAMLEAERRFLLSGRLNDIARLDARRESVSAHFENVPSAISDDLKSALEALKKLAARNQRLLSAYLNGAQSAAQRVGELTEGGGRIGAYREDGSRFDGPSAPGSKQQRV